jgi:hypothetical protein
LDAELMSGRVWTSIAARALLETIAGHVGPHIGYREDECLTCSVKSAIASLADQLDAFAWVECSLCHFRAPLLLAAGDRDDLLKKHLAACPARS